MPDTTACVCNAKRFRCSDLVWLVGVSRGPSHTGSALSGCSRLVYCPQRLTSAGSGRLTRSVYHTRDFVGARRVRRVARGEVRSRGYSRPFRTSGPTTRCDRRSFLTAQPHLADISPPDAAGARGRPREGREQLTTARTPTTTDGCGAEPAPVRVGQARGSRRPAAPQLALAPYGQPFPLYDRRARAESTLSVPT